MGASHAHQPMTTLVVATSIVKPNRVPDLWLHDRAAEIVWILEKTMQAGRNEPPRRCGAMLLERRSDCEIVCFPCLNLLQTTRKAIEVMRTKGTKDIFILLKAETETSSGMESLCADCSSWGITVDVHEVRANASC